MADLLYHVLAFLSLSSYGLYHLIAATRSFLKPPPPASRGGGAAEYSARPYHPLAHRHHLLRHLPLYFILLSLLIGVSHHAILSSQPEPLRVPRFISLQTAASLLLFLLLAATLPLSIPPDLHFLLAALAFALLSSSSSHAAASYPATDLQAAGDRLSSRISAASAALSLSLAVLPRLFLADLALSATLILQGLWSLQAGLSLFADAFIPEGCHRLLDVADAPTRCDLDDSRARAGAILDLAFVLHASLAALVATAVYAAVARSSGGGLARRHNGGGSYEALPTTSSSSTAVDLDHVQMKAIGKNSAQA